MTTELNIVLSDNIAKDLRHRVEIFNSSNIHIVMECGQAIADDLEIYLNGKENIRRPLTRPRLKFLGNCGMREYIFDIALSCEYINPTIREQCRDFAIEIIRKKYNLGSEVTYGGILIEATENPTANIKLTW